MAEVEAANTAQAIADRLVQQSSAEEFPAGSAPEETAEAEDTLGAANNKRPRDEDAEGEEDEQEQMRKRASFTAPEVAEGAETRQSGFSDAPASYSAEPSVAPQTNGSDAAAAAAAAAAVAAAAVASAPQMGDAFGPKTATLQIPATLVGKVIGKGGETIKNLQNQSRTRIQIDHTAPGDTKTITITSENPDYLEAAKHLIQQVVSDDSPQGEVQRSVECPPGIVGRIIGRGGETIRALQQASQAYIVVDQNFPEGHPRKVNISGRADAVERASRMVTELIQGEPGSATAIIQKYGAGVTRNLDCPKEMVGRVIGKGGETIKAMQREFQANIQIDQTSLPMKITISGQPASVERAYGVVAEIVAGGNPYIGGSVGHAVQGAPRGPAPGAAPGYGAPSPYGATPQYAPAQPAYGGYPGYPPAAAAPTYPGYGGGYPQASPYGGYPQVSAAPYGGQAPYGGASAGGYDPYGAQGQQPYGSAGGYGQQGAQPSAQPAAGGGGGQWSELQDNEGRSYYYNQVTGVSQWDRPADM
ncbi:MAG: hypothetical protein FRX49_09469 [Trebouxia sp. A1-2]|nr:MAG: hypothetical protein FRX49_09469 [Trebouxia sp. A1-2]